MGRRAVVVAFEAKWSLKGVNVSVLGVKGQATPFLGHVFIQQIHILCWAQKSSKKKKKNHWGCHCPQEATVQGVTVQPRVGWDLTRRGGVLLWTSPGWGGCGVERSPTRTLRQDLGGGQEAGNPSKFGAECGVPGTDSAGSTAWPGAPRGWECRGGAGGPAGSHRSGLCPCGRSRGQPLDDGELPKGLPGVQSSTGDAAQGRRGARDRA